MYRNTNPGLSSTNPGPFKHDKKLSYFLKINDERMALVMSSLIDREVEVNLEDGTQVKGIFNSFDPASRGVNKAIDIAINSYVTNGVSLNPHNRKPQTDKRTMKPMIVCGTEYHFFSSHGIAKSLFKTREHKPLSAKRSPTKFKTDTEISSSKQTSINPVLTEWRPTESVDESQLVELDKVEGEQWDQFETNRNEYGVVSTFDENMYTTSLDLNEVPDSVKERAEKLAAEIEGGTDTNYAKVESLLEDEDAVETESPAVKSSEESKEVKEEDPKEVRERHQESSNGTVLRLTMRSDKLDTDRHTPSSKPKQEKQTQQIGVNALNIEPTNLKPDSFRFGFSERKNKYSLEQEKKEKFEAPPPAPKPHDKQLYVPILKAHPYNHFRTSPHGDTMKQVPEHAKEAAREPHKEPFRVTVKETPREHPRESLRTSPKEGLKDVQRESARESPKETFKFTAKKSFKFNPNASTFTPTLVTAKTPSMPSDQTPLSSPAISPLAIQQAKFEFRPFNPMKRFPRLDFRSARTVESSRFSDHDVYGYKWEVDPSLSYRDVFGDLNPLFVHHHHVPMKPPNQMVPPGQPGPAMMPPGAPMNYPPYHVGTMPVGMVPYGPQVHPRLYNGVPYNHMGPAPMPRRGHPPLNPRYGHSSPLPNDQYMNTRAHDHYDDKAKGYMGHMKHKK
nr:hypothetical protein MACL_00003669 [Theileria orientalis]